MIFICTHWSSMCPNLRHEIRMLPSSLLDIVNSACCCGCHRTLYITLWIFGSAIYRDWGKELWESPITCQPTKIVAEPSFYCFIVAKLHVPSCTYGEICQLNPLSITSMYLCQENWFLCSNDMRQRKKTSIFCLCNIVFI